MAVFEKPNPYDMWERFVIPWYKRLLMRLFLDERERRFIYNRVTKINQQRKEERRRVVEAQREYSIRKMRERRNNVQNK
ncbi:MAG: hypothetical protein ACOCP4_04815 [Candidatus Woesearchaeota archaeon]